MFFQSSLQALKLKIDPLQAAIESVPFTGKFRNFIDELPLNA